MCFSLDKHFSDGVERRFSFKSLCVMKSLKNILFVQKSVIENRGCIP